MARILGISAFYHDSAAALVVDGTIVAAAQEERFSRIKHDARFPERAIASCLETAGLSADDLDYVAFYEKPLLKFDRLLETYLATAPRGLASFSQAMPIWLKQKLHLRPTIRRGLGGMPRARLVFATHHESHAASAFFPSPFAEAAILTVDGVGEWSTTTLGVGRGHQIALTEELRFPHSLGLLYSAFTAYCGFRVNSGEYKLMGLAPYGRPIYRDLILRELIDLRPDGSFRLNMDYFTYPHGLTMTGRRFHRRFGGPPRRPESQIEPRHMDLAASIQAVTEEVLLRIAERSQRQTGMTRLVMAGGVALNCVANGRLLREGPFEDLWVQPAAGDAGGALGAALFVWHQLLGNPRDAGPTDAQHASLLGPSFDPEQIASWLAREQIPARRFADEASLCVSVARALATGQVVGWFQGRMEFGPRALGARSILADPRSAAMQTTLNLKIKYRESFRPFAPAVLRERAQEWFDLPRGRESPYMLVVAPVREDRLVPLTPDETHLMEHDPDLRNRVRVVRSQVPAITHVDRSARVQTVDHARAPRFHALLRAFEQLTGCPILVNTSFNVRGEPIVCTPQDAYRCFLATEMDLLVLGDHVIDRSELKDANPEAFRPTLVSQYPLD
ncbi:carbamoyltransferase [Tautonia sp. JC769]|uniref:carbamoyltransferase family protein n=1 Tax=Tautonia sp. JC769 TaxID=3232135 RepID=UPI003458DCBA